MGRKNHNRRGIVSFEYSLTIGVMALAAAAMFAQTSTGIKGIWNHATVTAGKSPAANSVSNAGSVGCLAGAHGDSKVCSNAGF